AGNDGLDLPDDGGSAAEDVPDGSRDAARRGRARPRDCAGAPLPRAAPPRRALRRRAQAASATSGGRERRAGAHSHQPCRDPAPRRLRTPLSAVYGAATTLRKRSADLDRENRERLLAIIEEESTRLTQIIDQLLVTAQLDRGDLALVEEECDLPELAAAVVRTVEAHSPPGIELELL